jgi:phytoene desaturase
LKPGKRQAVVVGAGVGGLAAAARLAHAGFDVQVFEKTGGPGGRCNQIKADGFTWDLGPTIILMPEVFQETFRALGRRLEDYLTLQRCDPNYRIHYRDGSAITFTSELCAMGEELERVEPGSFQRYLAFLAQGRTQYRTGLDHLVGRNYSGITDYFVPSVLKRVFEVRAHRRMYSDVGRFFKDERLRAAMTFQSMYLGVSPFAAPGVFALLPFTELGVGVWFAKGGLYAIPLALEKVAREEGVKLHYNQPIKRILCEGKRTTGVELESGERVAADVVVCNADLPYAYEKLLDPEVTRLKRKQSLRFTSSGYMLYLGMRRRYDGFLHHNVYFGRDYKGSFDDIFERFRVPEDPSFYVNAPAHTDPSLAPPGKDSLYVLVPVPHQPHESHGQGGIDWKQEGPRVRAKVFQRLAELGYPDLERDIEVERVVTPDDWASSFNLARGSAFGLAQNFFQIGPFRPSNQDPRVRNLFFVGASTQPGTGLPTVIISARLAVERILAWVGKDNVVREPGGTGRGSLEEAA